MAVRLSSISAASQQRLSSRRRVLAQSAKVSGSARARKHGQRCTDLAPPWVYRSWGLPLR